MPASLANRPDAAGDTRSVDCIDGEIVSCPDVQRADVEGIRFIHLVIAEDDNGKWQRIAGTEPYLSGWTDELAEQVANHD